MRLYLAAYETSYTAYNVKIDPTYNVFNTYFYRTKTERALRFLKEQNHKGLITIDSGAHSFFGLASTRQKLPPPEVYFQKYLEWAIQWKDYFDYFCELDIQELVGLDLVKKWRSDVNSAGLGHKLITVYHSSDTWKDYEELCDNSRSRYVAIEGIRFGKRIIDYKKFIGHAFKNDVKIHGFAFTNSKLLYEYPFYSVDSSSWTMGPRYGALMHWDGDKMRTIKSTKANFMRYNVPISLHGTCRLRHEEKSKLEYSAESFVKLQNHMTNLWENRGVKWKD